MLQKSVQNSTSLTSFSDKSYVFIEKLKVLPISLFTNKKSAILYFISKPKKCHIFIPNIILSDAYSVKLLKLYIYFNYFQ